ncbi:unnamed protein product [Peniophora sp. CBMAI 1063]|nr:unnamed protein product [Peniophora sp. CBMAI 1063]
MSSSESLKGSQSRVAGPAFYCLRAYIDIAQFMLPSLTQSSSLDFISDASSRLDEMTRGLSLPMVWRSGDEEVKLMNEVSPYYEAFYSESAVDVYVSNGHSEAYVEHRAKAAGREPSSCTSTISSQISPSTRQTVLNLQLAICHCHQPAALYKVQAVQPDFVREQDAHLWGLELGVEKATLPSSDYYGGSQATLRADAPRQVNTFGATSPKRASSSVPSGHQAGTGSRASLRQGPASAAQHRVFIPFAIRSEQADTPATFRSSTSFDNQPHRLAHPAPPHHASSPSPPPRAT